MKSTDQSSSLAHKFAQRDRIQKILRNTKTYGMVFLIIEILNLFALGLIYITFNHPYFTAKFIPEILQQLFFTISAIIVYPIIAAGPFILVLLTLATVVALICLILSIRQLQHWKKLELSHQDYHLAIHSIVFNALALIPTLILLTTIIVYLIYSNFT